MTKNHPKISNMYKKKLKSHKVQSENNIQIVDIFTIFNLENVGTCHWTKTSSLLLWIKKTIA